MKISPENEQFFETVESAAFVICLDDQSVNNSAAAVKGVTLNDGANRWYGKGLQFVVGTDGSSAFIADHAMIDGLTVGTMNEWVHNSIQDHRSLASPTAVAIEDAGVEELHVTMSDDVATKIRDIQTRATKASLQRDYRLHTLSQLGKDFLLERKFPVKGIIDITIQLASRLYYEARGVPQPPAYEEASMNGFHHGRIRPFLTLSPAVNAFCEQATNTNPEPQSVKKLLYTAAQELALNTRLAGCSPALNHIVDVIEDKWPADIPEPALFDDPLWIRMNEFAFESGMTDGMSKDSAFFPLNPEHLFLCYYVEDDAVRVSICGPSSGVADFAECLDEAQRRMQRLITSE